MHAADSESTQTPAGASTLQRAIQQGASTTPAGKASREAGVAALRCLKASYEHSNCCAQGPAPSVEN